MADGLAAIAEVLARFDARLAAIEQRMGVSPPAAAAPAAGSAAAAASTQDDDLPQYIADFDALCAQHLTPLVEAAHKLGGNGAALVCATWPCQNCIQVAQVASQCAPSI